MTPAGYLFLAIGWGIVLWLLAFSIHRLFFHKKS